MKLAVFEIVAKDEIKVNSVSKLGMGTSNLNYLVEANGEKFVFRINMELGKKRKSRREFNGLGVRARG